MQRNTTFYIILLTVTNKNIPVKTPIAKFKFMAPNIISYLVIHEGNIPKTNFSTTKFS